MHIQIEFVCFWLRNFPRNLMIVCKRLQLLLSSVIFCSKGSKFVMGRTIFEVRSFEAVNRVFEFNFQKMNMFKYVRCLKKLCLSLFEIKVSKSSKGLLGSMSVSSKPKFRCLSSIINKWTRFSLLDVQLRSMFDFVRFCSIFD